ncbi:ABC transporter ATP-binding protein [Dehalobacter restrictus]|uniref:ATP-binding cassette domain-containing protein n=1 Tax=Dehalobacter restrictus TaxID=55583 RepID=A0A857DJT8_9FIRM|nr:ABC transporter ATP-binding protein [Dehalobacter restrictus]QHA01630.1 ATP-binding cassette domain-containing protein [Dehalobacter restrictus]
MSGENKNQNTIRNRQDRRGPGGPGGPGSHFGAPVEKAKNFRGSLARLIRYLKPHKVHLIVVLIFAIASTSFTIAAPKVSSKAINKLQDAYMARMMLQKMSEAQEKGVDSIYTQMADVQLKAVDQISKQIANSATSKPTNPESLNTVKALITLPAINTLQDPQEKANTVIKMLDLLNALPNMGGNSADNNTQNGTVKKIDADSIDTIKTFLQLPMLSSVTNAEEKADVCQKIIDLGEKMSATGATGLDMPNTQQNVELTGDQINGAITAIRETNGEYDFHYIGMIALILIGMYLISALFSLIMGLVMSGVSQRTVRDLRRVVDNKLAKLPLKYYDMHPYGDILSRVTNDIDTIATTLQQSLTQIITSVITIIGYIIMMLTISPVLTLIIIASLPLYMLSTTMIAKKSQKYFAVQQKELGDLSSHVEEMYTGHKIVKAFGHEKDAIEKFESINNRLYGAGWKAQFVSGIMFPLMNFISNLSYVGISIVGGIWITRNLLGLGDILAFIQYSRSFTMPIIQTANIANVIQSTIACAERVFEVLDEQEEIPDSPEAVILDMPKGNIRIDHVSFRYTEDVPLIEDMNLEVRQGDTIAIVGPTGAGKTTLVNLLMRFYEINSGKISIDGVDIKDMPRSELRKLFGMVLQDTWLFNGSIKDNITYSKEGATMEQIVRAAKAAHADHFIRTLPDGYDTILNEEATNISQGQKQLLTIARAILANPAILILDEATSSVDTRTEVLIQKAMKNLMKGRTNFVIAHRLSTIRDAELILVMNNGSIIETGNHKELLAKGGFYAELYNSQFSKDTDIAG